MSTTIECPVCNNEYKQLTAQHIFKHNLTIAEFKEKFPLIYLGNPDAEISKQKVRETQYVIDNIRCKQCDIIITSHDRKRRVFCSHTCSATYNNKLKEKIKKTCVYCKAVFTNHDRKSKYCSNKCQKNNEYTKTIEQWKSGNLLLKNYILSRHVRRYIFEKYNSKCSQCSWDMCNIHSGKIPLEVEHIDGNYSNNQEENLTLLCPNCHSLTKTAKGANRGNGRYYRRKRYQEGKSY